MSRFLVLAAVSNQPLYLRWFKRKPIFLLALRSDGGVTQRYLPVRTLFQQKLIYVIRAALLTMLTIQQRIRACSLHSLLPILLSLRGKNLNGLLPGLLLVKMGFFIPTVIRFPHRLVAPMKQGFGMLLPAACEIMVSLLARKKHQS